MRGIFGQILKVAPTDSTVLISGESGTGKELVATSLYKHSLRKGRPFVKINCVAIPEGLLESELFGHEKGAFTGTIAQKKGKFELADGWAIFLDESGDMPPATQAKLLRVLQEKEFERVGGTQPIRVDVRFITAANKNLPEMIKTGAFRGDLFYRLNVFFLHLPPLRERREDIPFLIEHFLEKSGKDLTVSHRAMQLILGYGWPGSKRG
jgi:transcriptional regulator with GAF, ATPase, and Fis domain